MPNFDVCAYNLQGLINKPQNNTNFTYDQSTMGDPFQITVNDDDIYSDGVTPNNEVGGAATYVSGAQGVSWNASAQMDLNQMGTLTGSDGTVFEYGYLNPTTGGGTGFQYMTSAPLVDGVTYTYSNITASPAGGTIPWSQWNFAHSAAPPCFTPGSLIQTARGAVAIETLKPDDFIATRDNGLQPLKWIYKRELSAQWFKANARSCPIVIKAGSLGVGVPISDLLVSPGHMMLVIDGNREVLVPASTLVGRVGIYQSKPISSGYIHLLFDHHQVVNVGGAWSESLLPNLGSYLAIGRAATHEVWNIFPELRTKAGLSAYRPARDLMYRQKGKRAIEGRSALQ